MSGDDRTDSVETGDFLTILCYEKLCRVLDVGSRVLDVGNGADTPPKVKARQGRRGWKLTPNGEGAASDHAPPAHFGDRLAELSSLEMEVDAMNVFMLFAGSGPLVILTAHHDVENPALLERLASKGIEKFIAFRVPTLLAKARYGRHFEVVAHDLSETDDLRVLDFDGARALRLFSFQDMSSPQLHEPDETARSTRKVFG